MYYGLDRIILYCVVLNHLKHFKVAHQTVIVGKVVAGDDQTLARFAPDVAEAVVAEVCHPGAGSEVNTAVGSLPAFSTETEPCTTRWSRVTPVWPRKHSGLTCATLAVTAAIIQTEKIHNILWRQGELVKSIPRPERRVAAHRLPAVFLDPVQVEHGVPGVSSVLNNNNFLVETSDLET